MSTQIPPLMPGFGGVQEIDVTPASHAESDDGPTEAEVSDEPEAAGESGGADIPPRFAELPKQVTQQAQIAGKGGMAKNFGRALKSFFDWALVEGMELEALPADACERFVQVRYENPTTRNMMRRWLKDATEVAARLYGAPFAHLEFGAKEKQPHRPRKKKETPVQTDQVEEQQPQVVQTAPNVVEVRVNATGKGGKKTPAQPAQKADSFMAGGIEFRQPFVRVCMVSDGSMGLDPGAEVHLGDVQTARIVASGGAEEYLRRTYVKALRLKHSTLPLGLVFKLYELNDKRLPTARVSEVTVSTLDTTPNHEAPTMLTPPLPPPTPFAPPFVPGGASPLGAPQPFAPVLLPPVPDARPVDDAFRTHVAAENTDLKRKLEEEGKAKEAELKRLQADAEALRLESLKKEYEMNAQQIASQQAQQIAELRAEIRSTQAAGGSTAALEKLLEKFIELQTRKPEGPTFIEIMQIQQKDMELRLQRDREEREARERREREDREAREKAEAERERQRREDERERQRQHEKFLAEQAAKAEREREERERRDREERERREREYKERELELKQKLEQKGSEKSDIERMMGLTLQMRQFAEAQGWTGGPPPSILETLVERAPDLMGTFFEGLKGMKVGTTAVKPRQGALPAPQEPAPEESAPQVFVLPDDAKAAVQALVAQRDDQAIFDAIQGFFVSMYTAGGLARQRVEHLGRAFAEADVYEDVFGVAKYLFRFAGLEIGKDVTLAQVKLVAQVAHHNYSALYAMITGGQEKVLSDAQEAEASVQSAPAVQDEEQDEGDEEESEEPEADGAEAKVAGAPEASPSPVELAPAKPVVLSTQPRRRRVV